MTRPVIRLGDLRNSFEGVIPSIIGTIDDDGMPNISYLSHVYYIDETHVALSNQFFSKTAANVRRLGVATVMVVDALSGAQYLLDLQFEQSCDSGEVFERISTHLDVMSHLRGHEGLMKLKSADIYRVTQIREVLAAAPLAPPPPNHVLTATASAMPPVLFPPSVRKQTATPFWMPRSMACATRWPFVI